MAEVDATIRIRRDLAATWAVINPTLKNGEPGAEMDTRGLKIGDGTTRWNDLEYWIQPTVVVAAVPVNTVAPSISGTAQDGQTLTCAHGTWSNTPTGYTYQWKRDGSSISGETASTYDVVTADVGHVLTCTVTASNGTGSGTPVTTSATSTVIAATVPPVNSVLPAISGTAQDGQTLSCSTGTWSNSPTGYTYAWKRDGSAISGATASTYGVVTADVGHVLTCTVTASNGAGAGSPATSSATGTVSAAPPDSRGRYGVGSATAGVSSPAALLAAMTVISGASNGSIVTTGFTVAPSGNYGWAAFESTASAGGVTFSDALGTGGWQGASSSGDNGADDGSSPNTSTVTYDDGTTTWRLFRQSYADAGDTITATA